jgi:hypothetical protein
MGPLLQVRWIETPAGRICPAYSATNFILAAGEANMDVTCGVHEAVLRIGDHALGRNSLGRVDRHPHRLERRYGNVDTVMAVIDARPSRNSLDDSVHF